MRKLSLSILAASAVLIPSAAFAQGGPPPGPPPGATWHGGGQMQGGAMMRHGGPRGGHHFQRRLQRGFVVPPMWFGPQYHISNWRTYGFADPGADGRWVRYYDDAYLIGRDGRIRDSREGLDWDQYGEEWEVADGVPSYRGSREWRPGDEDYAWSQQQGGQMVHGGQMQGGYAHGGGYGHSQVYGGGYGYGMYAYPIVIETVTTSGGGYSEEIIEEYVEVRQRARRPRARCRCAPPPRPAPRRPAPPRPPAGERG